MFFPFLKCSWLFLCYIDILTSLKPIRGCDIEYICVLYTSSVIMLRWWYYRWKNSFWTIPPLPFPLSKKILFRLLHMCHCKRMACLAHSNLWPQLSISGLWVCRPILDAQWQCFWMPRKGLRQRSWMAEGRSLLRYRASPCWECLLSEAHAGSPPSPRLPGPAHTRANITLDFYLETSRRVFYPLKSANRRKGQHWWVIMIVSDQNWWREGNLNFSDKHPHPQNVNYIY